MTIKQTELTFYSGIHTIGGVIVSVRYGSDRVLMEMGAAFDPKKNVFDGVIEPRSKNWLTDKLRLGILPEIDGLFQAKDLSGYPAVQPFEASSLNSAVFITHLHLDHMAHIGTVAPEIPVYMHRNAQIIEQALERTGEGVDTNGRSYQDLYPYQPVRVGEIEVTPVLCHDQSYFDFAFLIETPDGVIYWTGDLVLHGENHVQAFEQLNFLKPYEVDVLICDATAFMDDVLLPTNQSLDPHAIQASRELPDGLLSEEDYYQWIYDEISGAAGLTVFNYYQREMTDARKLMDWAESLGKKCVFEPDAAYLVLKFFGIEPCVYYPDSDRFGKNAASWVEELRQRSHKVDLDEILSSPNAFLVQNSYRHIMELFSLPKGTYLHMGGMPLGPYDPAFDKMLMLVEKAGFKFTSFSSKNYFSHAYPSQVKYFVDTINPHVLIPCHSYNPERLLPKDGQQLIPTLGRTYVLRDHHLSEKNLDI